VAPSTPGSGAWTSGSESSGEMERRTEDLVALIGPASLRTTSDKTPSTIQTQSSADDVPVQCIPPASTTGSTVAESALGLSSRDADNGFIHTVVVDVERPPSDGLNVGTGTGSDEGQCTAPLSRMRRSEACYDIAQLSAPADNPDSSSKPSSPLPTSSTDTETKLGHETSSEEEALKYLDSIACDYDNDETQQPRRQSS